MEHVNGGELFYRLSLEGRFIEERALIYGAELTLGIQYLHKLGIIFWDLKVGISFCFCSVLIMLCVHMVIITAVEFAAGQTRSH